MIVVASLYLLLSAAEPAQERSITIEAYIASLQTGEKETVRRPVDEREASRLKEINPEKTQNIEVAFAAFDQCRRAAKDRFNGQLALEVAKRLSNSELVKLTQYNRNGDYEKYIVLSDKEMEDSLSTQEQLELKRISKSYPIDKLTKLIIEVGMSVFGSAEATASFSSCDQVRSRNLSQNGIRLQ